MRFFIGVITVSEWAGRTQNITSEVFADWTNSREEALGAWFEKAREQHPRATIEAHSISDITDLARSGFRTGLFTALKHGDDEHQAWLKEAIDAYAAGREIPEVRGSGTKEARIKELEDMLEKVLKSTTDIPGFVFLEAIRVLGRDIYR